MKVMLVNNASGLVVIAVLLSDNDGDNCIMTVMALKCLPKP